MEELLKTARTKGRIEVLQSALFCAIRTGRLADAWTLRGEAAQLMGEAQREPRGGRSSSWPSRNGISAIAHGRGRRRSTR